MWPTTWQFDYKLWLKLGWRDVGGLRPPRTPMLSRGLRPPDPPKRRSAPLAAAVVRFLAAEPLVWGSCAAWGRTFSQKSDFSFEEATCPGQLRCLGQNIFSKNIVFFDKPLKPLVWGSFAAWASFLRNKKIHFFEQATCLGQLRCLGQNVLSQTQTFLNEPLVRGSFAAWGRTISQKSDFFGRNHLSWAASLPGAVFSKI